MGSNESVRYIKSIITVDQVILHRMPYMKMDKRLQDKVNKAMFVLMVLLGLNFQVTRFIQALATSILTPFCLFIYPGGFLYLDSLNSLEQEVLHEEAVNEVHNSVIPTVSTVD